MTTDRFKAFLDAIENNDDNFAMTEDRKAQWVGAIEYLYEQLQRWLTTYTVSGKIRCELFDVEINERSLGKYIVRQMHLIIGPHHIYLKPVGTDVIGVRGRLDMEGPAGDVKLVLVNNEAKSLNADGSLLFDDPETPLIRDGIRLFDWKIATPPPDVRFINLNQDSFLQAIMDIIDGG